MTNPQTTALRVIELRRWRNGYLIDLCKKALAGETIERSDTSCSEKEWEEVTG